MKKFGFGLLALAVSGALYSSAMAQRDGDAQQERPAATRDGAPRDGGARDGAPRDGGARDGAPRDGERGPGRGRPGEAGPDGGPGRGPEGGPGQGPGGRGFGPPPNPVMTALDKNGDHIISAEEIAGAVAALKTLDKNGDGQLTQDELRPQFGPDGPGRPGGFDGPPEGRGPGGPGAGAGRENQGNVNEFIDRLLGYDKNKDGKLSGEELPERMRGMLERGDTNGDKGLDRAELEKLVNEFRGSRGGDAARPPRDGERPAGDRPPRDGERPAGDRPPRDGERPEGERPEGKPPEGERPEGERPRRPDAE